jgi:hypothetical protein
MDGNSNAEEKAFKSKCDKYIHVLDSCPFSHEDAHTIYCTCFIPTIDYPLVAVTINAAVLCKLQAGITADFLSAMGYNQHMP